MTFIATFALDGEELLLKSTRITLLLAFEEKDQCGQTSSTATAEQGHSGTGGSGGTAAAEDEEKMTWFERRVLKPVNDSLG